MRYYIALILVCVASLASTYDPRDDIDPELEADGVYTEVA